MRNWLPAMSYALATAAACAPAAQAFEFRSRFTVWNGAAFVPVAGDAIAGVEGTPQRIRFEIGVFDDASGPAPAGGVVGWQNGTLAANGGTNDRTPGVLPPLNFLPGNQSGVPIEDPFTCVNSINVLIGTQQPVWGCNASGMPLPQPMPLVRGLNSYFAVYEVTTTPHEYSYSITFGGTLVGATEWRVVGVPTPPDCPGGVPGSVTYAPFPTAPAAFTRTLRVSAGPEIRTRFVRFNGSTFVPLCDDTLYAAAGSSNRVRLQVGVFDSGGEPAPAGGFVGWNMGTVVTTGGTTRRTPGRITPFNFGSTNGVPAADPFTSISGIDATLGTQSPGWNCTPGGVVPPAPPATIRGRNTYVDLFEITTVPGSASYSVTFGGNLITALEWRAIGAPVPPDCGVPGNPGDDVPGSITYAPFVFAPSPMCRMLRVQVGAGPVDCLGDGVPDACQTAFTERLYSLTGTSAGTPWSWCINSPSFSSVCHLAVPGVPAGQPALAVATAFANSINAAACPDAQLFAQARNVLGTTYLVVSVASQATGDTPFDLCVGPSGGPASCCPLMAFSSCSFNPTMTRIPTSGMDCNGNGHDDTIDIVTGLSDDTNSDGIPDECQLCPADFNQDGMTTSQDFFDYLAAFFQGLLTADLNHNGTVDSQDFFDFIAAFFAGC